MYDLIGKGIKIARENKGISQTELSKITGIHNMKISDYEKCKNRPSKENLEKIINGLDTSFFMIIFLAIDIDNPSVKNKFAYELYGDQLSEIIKKIF